MGKTEGWSRRFVASGGGLRFFSWGLSVLFSSYFVDGEEEHEGSSVLGVCVSMYLRVLKKNISIKMELV